MEAVQQETRKADILVVDDTPANLRLLSQMLVEQGYKVRAVTSGARALEAIQAAPPDLILLDIRMPEMSGYEVCARLKADRLTSQIPIIFISALSEIQDKVRAFDVGGVDYVTKPFHLEEVQARVATHLTLQALQRQLQDANDRLERELLLAGQVQASFLPKDLPDLPGWQLTVTLKPARETSGDFYDVNPLPDGRWGLLIADVVDKGAGAALFMALSWTLFRTYAAEHPSQPHRVFDAINRRILTDAKTQQFITAFYAVLDPPTGNLTYCNAGHNPPYLVDRQNGCALHPLYRTGIPLGILENQAWEQRDVQLVPGNMLVLYTDGVTDAQNEQGDFFEEKRLRAAIEACHGYSAQEVQGRIMGEILHFMAGAPQFDDIALMVLVRDGGEGQDE